MSYTYKKPVLDIRFNQPRILRWTRDDVRADSYDVEKVGAMVIVVWNDKKMFEGWLMEDSVGISQPEKVAFYALDGWEWLNSHILEIVGERKIKYNAIDEGQELKTCGEIIKEILDCGNIPGWICSGHSGGELDGMTVEPPIIEWEGVYIGSAINEVLSYQATHGAWIDPITKKMKFIDFTGSIEEKSVYLGVLNNNVLEHGEYNVKSAILKPTLRGCVTKVIVEGEGVFEKKTVELEEDWDESLEADWDFYKANTEPDTYGKVYRQFKVPDAINLPLLDMEIEDDGTVSGEEIIAEVGYVRKDTEETVWMKKEAGMDLDTGIIRFGKPIVNLRISYLGFYRFKMDVIQKGKVRLTFGERTSDLVVVREDLSGAGTEANYTKEKYIKDTNYYKLIKDSVVIRDDTSRMEVLGDKILLLHKDVNMQGRVVIDIGDEDVNWELGQKVRIRNSNKAEWDTKYLRIAGISYDFHGREATLNLADWKDLIGYEFVEDRRLLKEKADKIEKDVEKLNKWWKSKGKNPKDEVEDLEDELAGEGKRTTLICEVTAKNTTDEEGVYVYNVEEIGNIENVFYNVENKGEALIEVGDAVKVVIDAEGVATIVEKTQWRTITFIVDGDIEVEDNAAGYMRVRYGMVLKKIDAYLETSGTGNTNITVKKNSTPSSGGDVVKTFYIPSGQQEKLDVDPSDKIVEDGEYVSVNLTGIGTGAKDLKVILTGV